MHSHPESLVEVPDVNWRILVGFPQSAPNTQLRIYRFRNSMSTRNCASRARLCLDGALYLASGLGVTCLETQLGDCVSESHPTFWQIGDVGAEIVQVPRHRKIPV